MRMIRTSIILSAIFALSACGGGNSETSPTAASITKTAGSTVISSQDAPTTLSSTASTAVKSVDSPASSLAPAVSASSSVAVNIPKDVGFLVPGSPEAIARFKRIERELIETPATKVSQEVPVEILSINPKLTAAAILKPENSADQEKGFPSVGPQQLGAGGFTTIPYSPTLYPGWISPSTYPTFWPNYYFVFSDGFGPSTVRPPSQPGPVQPPPVLRGLDEYRLPAVKKFSQVPYDLGWEVVLSDNWYNFLYSAMSCIPSCSWVISDIVNAPQAAYSLSHNGLQPSQVGVNFMGHPGLDMLYIQMNKPGYMATLANAYDRKANRLLSAIAQLETLIGQSAASNGGRLEYQYALKAKADGKYPDVRYGLTQLKAGDVWKYGTSWDPDSRYSVAYLDSLGVTMEIQYTGTKIETLISEKGHLINHYIGYGELPPGNKIFK